MSLERTIAALDVAKQVAPSEAEYWMAREFQVVLGYKRWENFADAIQRARRACEKSGENPDDHFRQTAKMIEVGKTAQRRVLDSLFSYRMGLTPPFRLIPTPTRKMSGMFTRPSSVLYRTAKSIKSSTKASGVCLRTKSVV